VGHHIHAIIGAAAVVARAGELGLTGVPIALDSGFAWVPVPDHEIDRVAGTTDLPRSPWDERFDHFGSVLPAIMAELSMHGPVAYVETEYFGGVGEQVATAFDHRVRILECGSVNEALCAIGVRAARGRDEWEGAEPRRTGSDVRVFWILPDPIEPPSLDDAIRAFRFR
jgi:hypothetical protein